MPYRGGGGEILGLFPTKNHYFYQGWHICLPIIILVIDAFLNIWTNISYSALIVLSHNDREVDDLIILE